jgi:hypothetical protein
MSEYINLDSFWEQVERQDQKKRSYLHKIPSEDFPSEAYELFLTYATPQELEEDIVIQDTFRKITAALEWD